jgi:hypothetical protein
VHGYKLTIAADGTASGAGDVTATLKRSAHGVVQSYAYTFTRNVTLSSAPDLGSATLTASFGHLGSASLTFAASGPAGQGKLNGCPIASTNRSGTLSGSFTLKIGAFFHTVTEHSLRATLSQGGCTFGGGSGGGPLVRGRSTQFNYFKSSGSSTQNFTAALPRSGPVVELAALRRSVGSGAILFSTLQCTASRPSFSLGSNLKSATIRGGGRFSGTATFTRTFSNSPNLASGTARGTITARFDTGTQRLRLNATGTLARFG